MTAPSLPRRSVVLIVAMTAALIALLAQSASAGVLVSSAGDCDDPGLEQPFTPWLDPANYVLAGDGTFENDASGWQLDGASVVSGNEPYFVHGSGESHSLRLPAGSSATSPVSCVGLEHPTLRHFASRQGGSLLSSLKVEVLYEDALGATRSLAIGNVLSGSGFGPTAQMPIVANLLPLLPGERTPVSFRFTPQGSGAWRIDDVYVDPWKRR